VITSYIAPAILTGVNFHNSITMARTALITGATGLLGRQVVKAFERQNWEVVGTGFTRAKAPPVLKLDLGSEADITRTLDEVK
jgi:S-adenosylmethionine synthetase